jgi:hypothetical protein
MRQTLKLRSSAGPQSDRHEGQEHALYVAAELRSSATPESNRHLYAPYRADMASSELRTSAVPEDDRHG